MNRFETVVVSDISALKTDTKNCQKACLERHENLDNTVVSIKKNHEALKAQLFDPKEGIITMITVANARQGVITVIASFIGSTVGVLVIGYLFSKFIIN